MNRGHLRSVLLLSLLGAGAAVGVVVALRDDGRVDDPRAGSPSLATTPANARTTAPLPSPASATPAGSGLPVGSASNAVLRLDSRYYRAASRYLQFALLDDAVYLIEGGDDLVVRTWRLANETLLLTNELRYPVPEDTLSDATPGRIRCGDLWPARITSPNTGLLALGGDLRSEANGEYFVRLVHFDPRNANPRRARHGDVIALLGGHAGRVTALRISQDGRWIATIADARGDDDALHLWQISDLTAAPRPSAGPDRPDAALVFTPLPRLWSPRFFGVNDELRLAAVTHTGLLYSWRYDGSTWTTAGEPLDLGLPTPHLEFADGTLVAIGSDGKQVFVDPERITIRSRSAWTAPTEITAAHVSGPDLSWLADRAGQVCLASSAGPLTGLAAGSAADSPACTLPAGVLDDQRIRVVDVLRRSNSESWLAYAGGISHRLVWDRVVPGAAGLDSSRVESRINDGVNAQCIVPSLNGQWIRMRVPGPDDDLEWRYFDLASVRFSYVDPNPPGGWSEVVEPSAPERIVDGRYRLRDGIHQREADVGSRNQVTCHAYLHEGPLSPAWIVGCKTGLFLLREEPQAPQGLLGHEGWITHVVPLPGARRLVSAAIDGTVRVWSLESQDHANAGAPRSPLYSVFATRNHEWVAWTPDGYHETNQPGLLSWQIDREDGKASTLITPEQAGFLAAPEAIKARYETGEIPSGRSSPLEQITRRTLTFLTIGILRTETILQVGGNGRRVFDTLPSVREAPLEDGFLETAELQPVIVLPVIVDFPASATGLSSPGAQRVEAAISRVEFLCDGKSLPCETEYRDDGLYVSAQPTLRAPVTEARILVEANGRGTLERRIMIVHTEPERLPHPGAVDLLLFAPGEHEVTNGSNAELVSSVARALESALSSEYSAVRVTELHDARATRQRLLEELQRLRDKALATPRESTEDGPVFLVLRGSLVADRRSHLFLMPERGETSNLWGTAIWLEHLVSVLGTIQRNIVLVLDLDVLEASGEGAARTPDVTPLRGLIDRAENLAALIRYRKKGDEESSTRFADAIVSSLARDENGGVLTLETFARTTAAEFHAGGLGETVLRRRPARAR